MDFWNVVAAAAAVVAIATVAGLGLQRGVTSGLRESLAESRAKIEEQRGEIDDLKKDRADDRALIAQLNSDLAVLRPLVTGEIHWQAISDMLEHHHETAEKHWATVEGTLGAISSKLGGMA